MSRLIVVVVSVVLGTLRVMGVASIAFQAAAHVWIGGLLLAGIRNIVVNRTMLKLINSKEIVRQDSAALLRPCVVRDIRGGWFQVAIVIVLSLLELVCAIFGTL